VCLNIWVNVWTYTYRYISFVIRIIKSGNVYFVAATVWKAIKTLWLWSGLAQWRPRFSTLHFTAQMTFGPIIELCSAMDPHAIWSAFTWIRLTYDSRNMEWNQGILSLQFCCNSFECEQSVRINYGTILLLSVNYFEKWLKSWLSIPASIFWFASSEYTFWCHVTPCHRALWVYAM
jgi:hypothetical protein